MFVGHRYSCTDSFLLIMALPSALVMEFDLPSSLLGSSLDFSLQSFIFVPIII